MLFSCFSFFKKILLFCFLFSSDIFFLRNLLVIENDTYPSIESFLRDDTTTLSYYPSISNIELLCSPTPASAPETFANIDLYSSADHNSITMTTEIAISAIIAQELTINSGYLHAMISMFMLDLFITYYYLLWTVYVK